MTVWKCTQFIFTSLVMILIDRETDETPKTPICLTVKDCPKIKHNLRDQPGRERGNNL